MTSKALVTGSAMALRDIEGVYARMKQILTASIVDLCHGGLSFSAEMRIEGLLGITLDRNNVLLVNINEVGDAIGYCIFLFADSLTG